MGRGWVSNLSIIDIVGIYSIIVHDINNIPAADVNCYCHIFSLTLARVTELKGLTLSTPSLVVNYY